MRKSHKIRSTEYAFPRLFQAGDCLSRSDALFSILEAMDEAMLHPRALRLIQLFNIDPEELSEAGLSYEALKALERIALFI